MHRWLVALCVVSAQGLLLRVLAFVCVADAQQLALYHRLFDAAQHFAAVSFHSLALLSPHLITQWSSSMRRRLRQALMLVRLSSSVSPLARLSTSLLPAARSSTTILSSPARLSSSSSTLSPLARLSTTTLASLARARRRRAVPVGAPLPTLGRCSAALPPRCRCTRTTRRAARRRARTQ